jgi:hypothetical protein
MTKPPTRTSSLATPNLEKLREIIATKQAGLHVDQVTGYQAAGLLEAGLIKRDGNCFIATYHGVSWADRQA